MEPLEGLPARLHLAGGEVDFPASVLRFGDEERTLTPIEARLLGYLVLQAGRAVDARELLREVWGYRGGVVSNTVKTTMGRLRGKVERDPRAPEHLLTVPGVGYRFRHAEACPPTPAPGLERDGNLPPLATLVGREGEPPVTPGSWSTLVGPAGIGKSAVALQLAADLGEPAFLVPLAGVEHDTEAAAAIADALGLEQADEHLQTLASQLRGWGALTLVLDDADGCGSAVSAVAGWRHEHPGLTVLATRRAPVDGRGEQTRRIPPLAPDAARALFRRRAGPHALPDYADDAALAPVLERLDGLPLAIEMAAAWAELLDPGALAERLQAQLEVLRGPGGGRHGSLQAAFESSRALLDAGGREALAQVAVFESSFDLDSVDAVVRLPDGVAPVPVVRDLVRRGLAFAVAPPGGRGARFVRLLHGVRELAVQEVGDDVRARHASWFAGFGDPDALAALVAVGGSAPVARVQHARADLQAALTWSRERAPSVAARCLRALVVLSRLTGPVGAGLDEALGLAALEQLPGDERADLLLEVARAVLPGGSTAQASRLVADAARLALPSPARDAELAWLRAALAVREGSAEARAMARAAVEAARPLGATAVGRALVTEATVLATEGDSNAAEGAAELALEHLRATGDLRELQRANEVLAEIALDAGQMDGGRRRFEEALRLARERHDRPASGYLEGRLGALEALAGQHDASAARFASAVRTLSGVGARAREGYTLANLGAMELDRGGVGSAREPMEQALGIALERGDERLEAACRANLAELHIRSGQHERARRHLERAAELGRSLRFRRLALGVEAVGVELLYLDGDADQARERGRVVVEALVDAGAPLDAARRLESWAAREADLGEHERAATMLQQASSLRV